MKSNKVALAEALTRNARKMGILLSNLALEQSISNNVLCQRTGIPAYRVIKVMAGEETMSLDDISDVAFAMGAEIVWTIEYTKRHVPRGWICFP